MHQYSKTIFGVTRYINKTNIKNYVIFFRLKNNESIELSALEVEMALMP